MKNAYYLAVAFTLVVASSFAMLAGPVMAQKGQVEVSANPPSSVEVGQEVNVEYTVSSPKTIGEGAVTLMVEGNIVGGKKFSLEKGTTTGIITFTPNTTGYKDIRVIVEWRDGGREFAATSETVTMEVTEKKQDCGFLDWKCTLDGILQGLQSVFNAVEGYITEFVNGFL